MVTTTGRRALRAALVSLLVMGLTIGLLWLAQRKLIYFPDTRRPPDPAGVLSGASEVGFDTADGLRLHGWLVRPPDRDRDRAVAVLVAPGNAGNRLSRAPLARALADAGLTVLLVEYRGYGGNPGSPSQHGLARDVRAARGYLTDVVGVPAERTIYFGESLGAAVVTELATEHPPAALVLRSPFSDLAAVGRLHYPFLPVRALLRDRYPVAERVATIRVPTTVVLGGADSIVPPAQSRAVAAAAAGLHRLVEVPGADHNDRVLLDGDALVDAVVELAGR